MSMVPLSSFFHWRLLVALCVLGINSQASAQTTYTWNETTSGFWSTAAWDPVGPPATGATDLLMFGTNYFGSPIQGSSFTATDDITGAFDLNGLAFNNNGNGFGTATTITIASTAPATAINFSGVGKAIDLASTNASAVTISAPLTTSGSVIFSNASRSVLTLSGGLTLNPTGSLMITGGVPVSTATAISGNVTFSGSNGILGGSSGGLIIGGSTMPTLYNGTVTIQTVNSSNYTGETSVRSGTLALNFTNAATPAAGLISSNSLLKLGYFDAGGATPAAGKIISGAATAFTGTALGVQTFSGLTLDGGSNSITTTLMSVEFGSGTWTRNNNATLNIAGTGVVHATGISTSNGILPTYITRNGNDWATLDGSNNIVAYNGYSTDLDWATAGASANVSYTLPAGATTTVTGAASTINTLKISAAGSNAILAIPAGANTIAAGGILDATTGNFTRSILGGALQTSGDLVVNVAGSSNALTIASNIVSPTTNLVKTGPGLLVLTGTGNTYTGSTYINQGGLRILTPGAVPSGTTVYIAKGAVYAFGFSNPSQPNIDRISPASTGVVALQGNNSNVNYDFSTLPNVSFGAHSSARTYSGTLTPATIDSIPTYRLGGGNSNITVTGPLTVANSRLIVDAVGDAVILNRGTANTLQNGIQLLSGILQSPTPSTALGTGTITYVGNSTIALSGSADVTLPNNLAVNGGVTGTLTAGADLTTYNINGTISGPGNMLFAGTTSTASVLLLNQANTYSGTTTLTTNSTTGLASVRLGVNNALPTTTALIMTVTTGGAKFDLNNLSQRIASLTGGAANSSIVIGTTSGTLTIGGSGSATSAYGGIISGGLAANTVLTIDGTIQTLSGASTYDGMTTVVGNGTLVFPSIANVGSPSPLGQPSTAAAGTISLGSSTTGGTLQLIAATAPQSSNRSIRLTGSTGGGTLDSSTTTAANTFTISGDISASVSGPKTLTLTGSNTGSNTLSGIISDGSDIVSVTKSGAGTWAISNTSNTFTGALSITNGNLSVASLADSGTGSNGTGAISFNNAAAAAVLTYTGSGHTLTSRGITLSGSGGGVTIASSGTGALTLNTITNSTTLATALTLRGTNTNSNSVSGLADNGANVLSVVKNDAGSWTIDGANSYTGTTAVSAGIFTMAGTNNLPGNATVTGGSTLNVTGTWTGTSVLTYGSSATTTIVNVSNNMSIRAAVGGSVAGAVAVYNQTAGTVTMTPTDDNSATLSQNVVVAAGYGYFNLTGGTFKVDGAANGRFNLSGSGVGGSGVGVTYIGGGGNPTLDQTTGEWLLGYGNYSLTVGAGGTIDRVGAANPYGLMMNSATSYGVFNMTGGTFKTATQPIQFGNGDISNTTGFLNLAKGTIDLGSNMSILLGVGSGNNAYLNFAGGTIRLTANGRSPIPASTGTISVTSTLYGPIDNSVIDPALSFAGGLTVDTNGNATTTLATPLLGASGFGVTQANITIPGLGNSSYVGAPMVKFSDPSGGGVPAAGYAVISGGQVTGIIITSPGTYASGETPTITLTGGGGTITPFTTSALLTPNLVGGLTKIGLGNLNVSNTGNTYQGNKVGASNEANAGSLVATVSGTNILGSAGPMTVYGGTVDLTVASGVNQDVTTVNLGGGASGSTATIALGASSALKLGGTVTYSAANNPNPATISGTGASSVQLNATRTFDVGSSSAGSGALISIPDLTINPPVADGIASSGITKSGAGWLKLMSTSNTFTGDLQVNGGRLDLASSGVTNSISVSGSGTYLSLNAPNPASGAAFSTGTLTISDGTTLNFTLGDPNDAGNLLNASGAATVSGDINIDLTAGIGFSTTATHTYTLISAASGLSGTAGVNFHLNNVIGGVQYLLQDTSTSLTLNTSPVASTFYWKGGIDANWNSLNLTGSPASNWADAQSGGSVISAVPGTTTDVIFSVDSPSNSTTTTVDVNFSLKSLTVNDAMTTTIQGSGTTLTLANGLTLSNTSTGLMIGSTTPAASLALIVSASQNFTNNSSGLLTIENGISASAPATVLTITGSSNANINGSVSDGTGVLGLIKNGASTTLTLNGTNSFTGGLTVSNGTVRGTTATSLGTGAGTVSMAAGTVLQLANDTNTNFGRNTSLTGSATIVVDTNGTDTSVTHTLGTLGLGANTLTLEKGSGITGGNTASLSIGALTSAAGSPKITGTLDGLLTGTTHTQAGNSTLTLDVSSSVTFTGLMTASAAGTHGIANNLPSGKLLTLTGISHSSRPFTLSGSGNTTIDGSITMTTSAGNFTITNIGMTTINNVSMTTGALIINAGSTTINGTVAASSTPTTDILRVNTTGTVAANNTISGATGTTAITKSNTGSLILTHSNTFAGNVDIHAGTVAVTADQALGDTVGVTNLATNASATLEFRSVAYAATETVNVNIANATIAAATGTGDGTSSFAGSIVMISATNFAISSGSQLTVSGQISGTSLTKTATTGTLIFEGSNNYTGTTDVNGGTLKINGNQSSATGKMTVSGTGTTLGGSGTIGGAVDVTAGSILAPGASIESLNVNGNVDFTTVTSKFAIELNDTISDVLDMTGGTATTLNFTTSTGIHDGSQIVLSGSLSPDSNYSFNVAAIATGGSVTVNHGGFSLTGGHLAGATVVGGSLTAQTGPLAFDVTDFAVPDNTTLSLDYDSLNQVVVLTVATPEPASMGMIVVAGLGALRLIRRRGSKGSPTLAC